MNTINFFVKTTFRKNKPKGSLYMKKTNQVLSGVLKAIKARKVMLMILTVFLLIGFISYWSYQRTMQKLLNGGILSGTNASSVAADIAKQDVEKESEESTSVAPPATQPSNNMGFSEPLDGEVINEYSNGDLVKSKTLGYWLTHDGVDIKAELGTAVMSAGEGIVSDVYDDTRFGTCIEIDHQNGVFSYYFGLANDIEVSNGDSVVTGQKIGSVGDTAEIESKEETHLHFAMKQNGEWIDPLKYIDENR